MGALFFLPTHRHLLGFGPDRLPRERALSMAHPPPSDDLLTCHATDYHAPVLVREVLDTLRPRSQAVYLDATLGGGGHAEAILRACAPAGRVIGIDRDPEAIATATARLSPFGSRFFPIQANYSDIPHLLQDLGIPALDGLLLDAGVSSHQLDSPARGFSFRHPGPLDMRLGPDAPPLSSLLDTLSFEQLATILGTYGEVKAAGRVARAILHAHAHDQLPDTAALAQVVEQHVFHPKGPKRKKTHPATQVFQALRIAVNDELAHLSAVIDAFPAWLTPKTGVAAFISFHSLEDRIVKQGLKRHLEQRVTLPGLPHDISTTPALIDLLHKKGLAPKADEVARNPRARSARLRGARRL